MKAEQEYALVPVTMAEYENLDIVLRDRATRARLTFNDWDVVSLIPDNNNPRWVRVHVSNSTFKCEEQAYMIRTSYPTKLEERVIDDSELDRLANEVYNKVETLYGLNLGQLRDKLRHDSYFKTWTSYENTAFFHV